MTNERYIATLAGCAIGDTLGMPLEGLISKGRNVRNETVPFDI